jgi:predicted methyltransferase
MRRTAIALLGLAAWGLSACALLDDRPPLVEVTLEEAIAAPYRDANRARDLYRHPLQTLQFFGVENDMTVVEIWPGGGWYTEILAPFLRAKGHYVAAVFPDTPDASDYRKRTVTRFKSALQDHPDLFDGVIVTEIGAPDRWAPVPANTADMVLTFRNVHNWMAEKSERPMFESFFQMLKPGGVLGVVEHRAPEGMSKSAMVRTGYVSQEYVIELATQAGFVWAGWDDVNANPKDTKDYPGGVWTLPPTLKLGKQDREKYIAIGESDRMTLKFVKPDPNAPPPTLATPPLGSEP